MSARAVTSRRLDVAIVAALCAVGLALRAPGLTRADLWFDDAWAALPAHVGFYDAIRMVVTAPGYTLALREWLVAGPHATWWAQLPSLVLGVAGVAAVYGLVRALGGNRLGAFAAGAAVLAGPVTIAYSTRLKEYPADLLCACLLFWLAERWRREPSPRHATALAVAGVASLWLSASTAVVVGGAAAVVLAAAWGRRELRGDAATLVGILGIASLGLWLAFLRRVPAQLRANWRTHGFLFGYSSPHHLLYTFQQTFSGLLHGLTGLPIPWTSSGSALRALPMVLAVVCVLALVLVVEPPLAEVVRSRGRTVGATFGAAVAVVLAVLGTLTGAAPLGDGRTDEVLYPALLVLAVAAASSLASRATTSDVVRRAARLGTAGAVALAALAFGAAHVAAYPPTGLRAVVEAMQPRLLPGDVVVVDGYESFTWADDGLEPWSVSFAQGAVPWPMGFHVVSENPTYVLSSDYLQPDQQVYTLPRRTRRVWYVGPTVGGYSTAAPKDLWGFEYGTPVLAALSRLGFVGTLDIVNGPGVYARLFVLRVPTG